MKQRARAGHRKGSAADIAQHVEETVSGVRIVKGFGQETREVRAFEERARRLYGERLRVARITSRLGPPLAVLPVLGLVAVFGVGGVLAFHGTLTIGTFLAFSSGTGATAAVLLEILPPGARIISLDVAAAMQAAGRRALPDPRISWITARAEDAARHISEPADAVVCNSAIWKTDTPAVFTAVKQALRPGGRFVFNIGGSFAGLPAGTKPRPGPSLNELITAVAAEQYGYKPSPDPRPPAPLTASLVKAQLRAAGFTVLGTETVTHTGRLEEKRAWLSIPAFARPAGPFTYEQRMEMLERAYARADASRPVTTAWLVVTAEA